MKLLIAGSRGYNDYFSFEMKLVTFMMNYGKPTEIVCGMCDSGADKMAVKWANQHKVPIKEFPADWQKYGKAAGPIRNKEMAPICDRALIFWDAKSRGTANMIEELKKANKPYQVFYYSSSDSKTIGS